jgi:hypothetical protein
VVDYRLVPPKKNCTFDVFTAPNLSQVHIPHYGLAAAKLVACSPLHFHTLPLPPRTDSPLLDQQALIGLHELAIY